MRARLILDEKPLSGAENMEKDLELLRESCAGAPPTLRLYRWSRPTVSMGRFQKDETVDLSYATKQGIDVVRRPTGGKGVLHDDELTYSFTGSLAHGVPRGVERSYAYLSQPLVASFEGLGVCFDNNPQLKVDAENPTGACYLTSTPADLRVNAAKLSGSAQVWQGDSVLQHGCFVRSRDVDREARVFMLDERARSALVTSAISLEELLGKAPSFERIISAVVHGFSEALELEFDEA